MNIVHQERGVGFKFAIELQKKTNVETASDLGVNAVSQRFFYCARKEEREIWVRELAKAVVDEKVRNEREAKEPEEK